VSEPELKTVELKLAETGSELGPALEAAQFARFLRPEDPESEAEAAAMTAFVEAFSACTELWEEGGEAEKRAGLAQLGGALERLERLGLFVHAGAVQLDYDAGGGNRIELPVAIVTITRNAMPTGLVMVPAEIEAADEGSTTH